MMVWVRRIIVFKREHRKEKAFYWLPFPPIVSLSTTCGIKVTSTLCEISFSIKGYYIFIVNYSVEIRLEFLFQISFFTSLTSATVYRVKVVQRQSDQLERCKGKVEIDRKRPWFAGETRKADDSQDRIPPGLFLLTYP